jgi:PAS domain S-box-containing protein
MDPARVFSAAAVNLAQAFDGLPVAIALNTLEAEPRVVFLNEQFVRLFGYTLADIPTVPDWAVRAYPDEAYRREAFRTWDAAVARARREHGRVESMELRVVCKDGAVRDVVIGAAVVADHLLVTFTDVTERRRAEAALATARAELERTAYEITENIPVGTYTMVLPPGGGMGRFEFLSDRFLELCGLDREEARSDPFKAFACVHPDDYDAWVAKNAEVFANKLPFYGECRVVADGVVRWISAESRPRDLPDGSTVWEGVLIDITRQKTAEADLAEALEREVAREREQRQRLERKLKTSLTASAVAHEIHDPLSTILLQASLGHVNPDSARQALATVAEEARRAVKTIEKMKVLLRSVQTAHETVDLGDVVRSSLLQIVGPLAERKIVVEELGFDEPAIIHGDAAQLQLAITNALRNAIEAIASTGAAEGRIAVTLDHRRTSIVLAIGDSGPGWSGAERDTTPFSTTKPSGSGIGLYVIRAALRNHDGKLAFKRSPLGGAELRLRFPRAILEAVTRER